MTKIVRKLFNKEASLQFAEELLQLLEKENIKIITFDGELGSGKSFIIAQMIKALMHNTFVDITSPTFNLVNEYTSFRHEAIFHFDLYRIEQEAELTALGMQDYIDHGICFIEWPKKAWQFIAKYKQLNVKLKALSDNPDSQLREASYEILLPY